MSEESTKERYIRLEAEPLVAAAAATRLIEKAKQEFLARHYTHVRSKL